MFVGKMQTEAAALVVLYTGTQRKKVGDVAMGVTQQLAVMFVHSALEPPLKQSSITAWLAEAAL